MKAHHVFRRIRQSRTSVHQGVIASFASAIAYGGGLWIHLLHEAEGAQERHAPHTVLHWLRDATLALPLVWIAVWCGLLLARIVYQHYGRGTTRGVAQAIAAISVALCTTYAVTAGSPIHGMLFEAHHSGPEMPWYLHMLRDGLLTFLAHIMIAGAIATRVNIAQIGSASPWSSRRLWRWSTAHRATMAVASAAVAFSIVVPQAPVSATSAATTAAFAPMSAPVRCSAATVNRTYDVAAINVIIPYNRYSKVINLSAPEPAVANMTLDGQVFVLRGDKAAVDNWHVPLNHVKTGIGTYAPGTDPAAGRRLRPRPLVLRANAGECVKVIFTNELREEGGGGLPNDPRASIEVRGPSWDAQTSAGSSVGYNADTTVPNEDDPATPQKDNQITYYWQVPEEGLYLFRDGASLAGAEGDAGSVGHGLYGALAVEPAGSTWLDPVSGAALYTGTGTQSGDLYIDAMIRPPTGSAFRESIQLSQDELPGSLFGFNYGSEPQGNREGANACPDCIGEETSLSSWVYGDPALIKLASGLGPWLPEYNATTGKNWSAENCGLPGSCYVANVVHTYKGDPTKIRYAHAGTKETHVFHMHAHQWLMEPKDVGSSAAPAGPITDAARPESMTIDSQTYGPGESFTADLLYGSGSKPGTVGDSIFHCHLYPHFAEGFWALFRTHDVLENGSHKTPDGIFVRAIKPLPARTALPTPDYVVDGIGTDNPGYPRFIPGEFGWRAPQVPYGVTDGGPQGTAAIRLVAGKPLDPAKLAIERGVFERAGRVPKPGAPYVDPCPAGAREVTYNVSVIQTDIVYNEAGWHDTQARILVLDKDVDDVLAGRKPPEPMFIRVNAGDCVNYSLTNRLPHWIGNDAFLKLQQTNLIAQHIHLVKFDVLGSDGSTNGWNYQEAAFTKIQKEFNDRARTNTLAAGETCSREEGCRVNDPTDWDPSTRTTANDIGQTIHSRWYADYQLRTVFTHDHHFAAVDQNRGMFGALLVEPKGMDFRNPKTGEYYAPINNAANGTVCGTQCVGTAAGTAMDVIGPGTNDDFREFGLAFQDFVSLTRQGGNPRLASDTLNPPVAPEHFPDDDPGVMGVNYRNAPFKLRETLNGSRVDPAYRLSSTHFGDPKTPLLQAYSNDPIRLRLIQGSQEEQHVFTLHGVRWRDEADDPQSPLSNSRALGISDAINFEVPEIACAVGEACKGDFLYTSASTDDMYLGMWGLMRVYGTPYTGLLGLPDNQPSRTPPLPSATAPCPSSAPVRQLHVVALDAKITYNEQGDHDPYGLMYALVEPGETPDQAVARARAKPEPLAMRANAGDCLEVRLTNKIDPQGAFARLHAPKGSADGDPNLPLETPSGTPAGLRVSLHPQLLRYDVRSSDGAAVGFNPDQTVAPGASIVYRWFADEVAPGELGTTNLLDYGDIRGHRHHGLFAGLTIEPKGATHHDPFTGAQIRSGVSADIRVPGMQDFREFTLFFQDGLNLRDSSGAIIEDPAGHPPAPDEPPEGLDAEDQGEKGFNYANAPFRHRLGGVEPIAGAPDGQALARVFSSTVHGDPKTPIFRAYAGDPVRMRVLQGADKPRQHTFSQAGHAWKAQPDDPGSTLIGTQGAMTVARALNVHFDAGGAGVYTGDYRYNCNVFFHHQSGGLWGITRVYEAPAASALSTPDQLLEVDNPHQAGYHPLMPLEQAEVSATIFNDSNANGVRDASEGPLANASVTLRASDGTTLATRSTDTLGQAIFRVARGSYNLGVGTPPDWAATGPTSATVDATAENARFSTVLGMVQLADVAIRIFDDKNGNQVLDTGEPALAGWQVNLTGNGVTLADTTSTAGLASFDGLKPGSYSATAVPQAGWSATKPIPVAIAVSENMSLQPPNDVRIGFRTAAAPAPTVTSRTPAINAKGVNKASNVTATFSEAVTGVSASSFVLKRGTTVIAAVVSYDATTKVATLNPNADLAADAVYTVELTGGIKNAAGTALLPVSWNFTTGPVPTVSSRSPASGATGVLVGANVTATFSEAVNGVSGTTFVLKNGTTTIAAVVSYNATTKVATLNPNANLARNTVYTVQLTGGIADLAGNPLAATSWKFTTQP